MFAAFESAMIKVGFDFSSDSEQLMEEHIIPADALFSAYPALHLTEALEKHYRNGVKLSLQQLAGMYPETADCLRVYAADGQFLGLAKPDRQEQRLRIVKNL